jgi:small redox-active disulfide protein 2
MEIKVLGAGCAKCRTLEKSTRKALEELGINATVTKIEDIAEIMKYGIMITPALVIDEKIALKGVVPSVKELTILLKNF